MSKRPSKRIGEQREAAVYVISVAAELAGVHPQTLRMYERKGLLRPQRTQGNTRRYSQADIEIVRLIQELTQEKGMNLAGVEMFIELSRELERAQARMDALRREAMELQQQLAENLERIRQAQKTALVPLRHAESPFGAQKRGGR